MKKAIVTGAGGFVGAAVCKELAGQGVEVTAVARYRNERVADMEKGQRIRIVYNDLSDAGSFADIIAERDIDAFYHFAWAGSAGLLRGDAKVQMDNVKCAYNAVNACAALGCRRFVFASSIMEYEMEAFMATETEPGINMLYCIAKKAANYMARTVSGSLGIDFICAVISNIYGPGELSPRLVNTSLRKMLDGERCSFTAGDQMYDFLYITDAAKAFAAIGEMGRPNKAYYIGSQNPRPLKEFLVTMRDCVDSGIKIGLGEVPFNGVSLTYREFDVHSVKNDTGFVPTVSFTEGIQNTIAWLRREQ